jgi:hypothetical protein
MKNDEVKTLQEFLKQFPNIYPEGLVTGYFGPLTEAAVKRFQAKNIIESIGIVGPKTRAKINELITSGTIPKKSEEKIPALTPTPQSGKESLHNEYLPQLTQWANENKIEIVTTKGESLTAIPGIDYIFDAFKKIPPHLLKVFQNETIQLETSGSCWSGGYTSVASDQAVKEKGIKKVPFMLCHPFNEYAAIHEFGHIVAYIGIRNEKSNEFSLGKTDEKIRILRDEYNLIFQVSEDYQTKSFTAPPSGFISIYAAHSELENFAEHFYAYIDNPQYFRERATKEPLLAEKYEFLKTKIFLGKEY